MASINKVILIGNLGKDPEVRKFENGNKVCTFSLATSESYTDKNGNKQGSTDWHNIKIWGKLADVAEKYLSKGDSIYLEGKISYHSYEDKNGNTRKTTDITVLNMQMIGSTDKKQSEHTPIDETDDLPF